MFTEGIIFGEHGCSLYGELVLVALWEGYRIHCFVFSLGDKQ